MSYDPNSGLARAFPLTSKLDFAPGGPDGPHKPGRDVKKIVLVTGLGLLSWVATYIGMLELIEANMGELPLVHKVVIGFSVAMLMTMIIWLLDQMFSPVGFTTKLCYVVGYIFLSLISVGFGFGFYWKVLESRAESSRSAESAVTQVQSSLHAASTRLEQLDATLVQLATVSREKAELERTKGTSCPNSRPGDGPRRKMRDEDASRFSFASEFVRGRVGAVKADMAALNGDLAKIASADASTFDLKSGTRNEFMKALSRKLDMTVTGFNAFRTDPQLRQLRSDLDDRADKSTFGDPKKGGFVCPDAQLQHALKGAVRAIDQLPELTKPEVAAVEGSEATIEAFRRLGATFYGLLSFKLPPSADELRELQKKAVQSVEANPPAPLADDGAGLSKRDYVPLAIAVFVDICLLLVSIGRPVNRLHGLMPKMREAEQGPIIEILSRFNDIHRDREVRESFELFRHVVFDLNGDYYVAVPLDAPPRMNPQQREQLRLEAQLLSNLFASFEKERIFTRTWTPFTRRIQSKLKKQGSKFAESEAFRVYRFRKGAWSEIILGAVMGAARRAEEGRRRMNVPGAEDDARPLGFPREPVLAPFGPGAVRTSEVEPAGRGFERLELRSGTGSLRSAREPRSWRPQRREEAPAADPRFKGFGSYAASARAELSGSPHAFEPDPAPPANSNTMPSQGKFTGSARAGVADAPIGVTQTLGKPSERTGSSEPAARDELQEATIGVIVKRETVTIPVSEAQLARSLPSLLARALSTGMPQRLQTATVEENTPEVGSPFGGERPATQTRAIALPAVGETTLQGEDSGRTDRPTDWDEADVTIARRFKPGSAA